MTDLHIENGSQLELILVNKGKIPATVLGWNGNGTGAIALKVDDKIKNPYDSIKALYTQPANGSPETTYLLEGRTLVKWGILIMQYSSVIEDRRKKGQRLDLKLQDRIPIALESLEDRRKSEGKLYDITTKTFGFMVQEASTRYKPNSKISFNFVREDKPNEIIKGDAVITRATPLFGRSLRWTSYGAHILEMGPWPRQALYEFIKDKKNTYEIMANPS